MHPDLAKLIPAGQLSLEAAKKLSKLEPGTFCEHRSWGVGCVVSWDVPDLSLKIDFETKSAHPMKMQFAASNLTVLPADHFKVRRFQDKEGVLELSSAKPAEFLRDILISHGGSIDFIRLEDLLKPSLFNDKEFKSWWDKTRKALKGDLRFVIPARRTEPILLRDESLSASDSMVADVINAKTVKAKLIATQRVLKDLSVFNDAANQIAPLIKNVDETAPRSIRVPLQVEPTLELLALRESLLHQVEGLSSDVSFAKLLYQIKEDLLKVVPNLSALAQRVIYGTFPETFGDQWVDIVITHIQNGGLRTVQEAAAVLEKEGQNEALKNWLQKGIAGRTLKAEVFQWIARERKGAASFLFGPSIGAPLIECMEKDFYDEDKKSNRLLDLLSDDKELVADLLESATDTEVRLFSRRILSTPVLDPLTRKSILARVIKLYPDVQEMLAEGDATSGTSPQQEKLIVSWDSLENRRKQLEEIIQVKIPQNVKEIQIAKSYGDLRENFEFKAAKQMQAVLMRQKEMLERDLNRAQGTDFKGADTKSVSIGTVVDLESTNQDEKITYTILGAWDTDPERHYLSYLSESARALIGSKVGEVVQLPSDVEGKEKLTYQVKAIRSFIE